MTCIKCGGNMIGDGYTSFVHCEYAPDVHDPVEPDGGPFYCDYEEAEDG